MSERKTDQQMMCEAWVEVKHILRAYVDAGSQRDLETTIGKLRDALVNERFNAVADRIGRRRSFEVIGKPRAVWIYENGETEKWFYTEAEAKAWLIIHDPGGLAIKHEVGSVIPAGQADRHGVPRAAE